MKDLKKEKEYNLVLEFKEITAPFPLCPICKQTLFPDGFFVLNYKCRRCRKNFEQSVKNGKWAEVIESSLLDQVRLEERKKTLEEVRDMIVKEGLIVDGNKKYESFEDGFNEGIEKSIEVINNNLKLLKEENEKE